MTIRRFLQITHDRTALQRAVEDLGCLLGEVASHDDDGQSTVAVHDVVDRRQAGRVRTAVLWSERDVHHQQVPGQVKLRVHLADGLNAPDRRVRKNALEAATQGSLIQLRVVDDQDSFDLYRHGVYQSSKQDRMSSRE